MSAIRKTIARRLSLSKLTIPHFYTRQSINARSLMDFYQRRKQQHHCTLNDVIVKAVALAVHEFPEFRSRIDEETIIETPNTHIGVAVGIEGGLVVPTVLHADRLPLQDLSKTIRGLVELARERRIENAGKSVFTVSNLGMLGTEEFTAIINPPEVAILAVGAICSRPVVVNGALAAGLVMVLTLSCDHRVIDGVVAAKFMAQLQRSLESPDEYLTL
jgi:pyruvate dehydrogenase E2 component (dihydrolipoamide acetyltransferase)